MSPTDCCDVTRRLRIARRFGSAIMSNTDSTLLVYSTAYILVKAYKRELLAATRAAYGNARSYEFWRVRFRAGRLGDSRINCGLASAQALCHPSRHHTNTEII